MWNPNPTDYCGYYYTKSGYAYVNLNGASVFTLTANAYTIVGILPETVTPTFESASLGVILGSTRIIMGVVKKDRKIMIYNTGEAITTWIFSFCFPFTDQS